MKNEFTPSQKKAITAPGSAAVVAGAGSGKTLVLIERFRHLLANDVPLNRILAFTFTEKAAGEISQRLLKAGIIRDDEEVQAGVGTIHSFFTKLLRRHGPLLGLDPDFKILGDASQVLALETRLNSFLLSKIKENNPVLLKYSARFGFKKLSALIQSLLREPQLVYSQFKTIGESADLLEVIASFFNTWLEEKIEAASLHYDDLEVLSLKLLDHFPEILAGLQRRYSHILVDEFQDTNIFQGGLLSRLFDPALNHLFVVGDPKQSIYRFRRADISIFNETVKKIEKIGGAAISLNETFRLPPALTATVNKVFTPLFGESGIFESMESMNRENPGKLEIVIGKEEGERDIAALREKEAKWIAQKIVSLNLPPEEREECALLFRTRAPMAIYQEELICAGIPCRVASSASLFDNQEILDFTKIMAYLAGDRGLLTQASIMRSVFFDFSESFIEHFISANCPHFLAPTTAGLFESDDDKNKWNRLITAIKRWGALKEVLPVSQLLLAIKDDLAVSPEFLPHFEELFHLIGELDEETPQPLEVLYRKLSLLADQEKNTEAPGHKESAGSVLLMTIHAAKGLEFKRVFLPQLHATVSGDSIDAFYDPSFGLVMKEEEPAASGGLKIALKEGERYAAMKETEEGEKREESKRLLYVAMTRSKGELTLFLKEPKKKIELASSKTWNEWLWTLLPEERETAHYLNEGVEVIHQSKIAAITSAPAPLLKKGPIKRGKPFYAVSQIETYLRCGKEYELKYQFGITPVSSSLPQVPPFAKGGLGGISAQKWGILIHEIFQFLDFTSLSNLETVVSQALANQHLLDDEGAVLERVKTLVTKILEQDSICQALTTPEKFYTELPFFLDCGGFFLKGTFDRLVNISGRWLIIDYKTDRLKNDDDLKNRQESYRGQMTAYAVAASRILGINQLSTALLFTDAATLVEEEWNTENLANAELALSEAHAEIEERERLKEFSFTTNREICPSCPYFARNYCGVKG